MIPMRINAQFCDNWQGKSRFVYVFFQHFDESKNYSVKAIQSTVKNFER